MPRDLIVAPRRVSPASTMRRRSTGHRSAVRRRTSGGGGVALLLIVAIVWYGIDHHATVDAPTDERATTQVRSWIAEADRDLVAAGVPAGKLDPDDTAIIISHESGGNPDAANRSAAGVAAGNPEGLMQTTVATFHRWALPGRGDIYDPVDNIIAGTRYALGRYGSLDNVPGVRSVRNGGRYLPY